MNKIVNVAFSGSGQAYPCWLGSIMCLEDHGIKIAEISGTSGGSIIAAAYGSGLDPKSQMIDLIKETLPFQNLLFDPSLISMFTRWGIFKGDKIQAILAEKFCPTLGHSKIPIYITSTNLTQRKSVVFNSKEHPGMLTALAVRSSISIPFLFATVDINGDDTIDGGWAFNYPVSVFKNEHMTLGFKFKRKGILGKINGFFSFVASLFETMIAVNEKDSIEDARNAKTIHIKTNYSPFNFFVSKKDVDKMIQEGYQSTKEWLMINSPELFDEFKEVSDEDIIETIDL